MGALGSLLVLYCAQWALYSLKAVGNCQTSDQMNEREVALLIDVRVS